MAPDKQLDSIHKGQEHYPRPNVYTY